MAAVRQEHVNPQGIRDEQRPALELGARTEPALAPVAHLSRRRELLAVGTDRQLPFRVRALVLALGARGVERMRVGLVSDEVCERCNNVWGDDSSVVAAYPPDPARSTADAHSELA